MTTWAGWQQQLLSAAGLPDTAANRGFLADWAAHANHPGCVDNPVDISHHEQGSADCASLPNGKQAQRFASHGSAAIGFADQLNLTDYPDLRKALASNQPYTTQNAAGVALNLQKWGSTKFQTFYIDKTGIGSGFGGSGGRPRDAQLLRGWKSLQHSLGHDMRSSLHSSAKSRRAALQALARARKVKL